MQYEPEKGVLIPFEAPHLNPFLLDTWVLDVGYLVQEHQMFHTPAHKQFQADVEALKAVVDPIVEEVTAEWNRLIQPKTRPIVVPDEDEAQDCREE